MRFDILDPRFRCFPLSLLFIWPALYCGRAIFTLFAPRGRWHWACLLLGFALVGPSPAFMFPFMFIPSLAPGLRPFRGQVLVHMYLAPGTFFYLLWLGYTLPPGTFFGSVILCSKYWSGRVPSLAFFNLGPQDSPILSFSLTMAWHFLDPIRSLSPNLCALHLPTKLLSLL